MLIEEDKMTRIRQNILLTDYYQNKGQFPQKYLNELQKLASQSMHPSLESAPKCQIASDGNQIVLGDWTNVPGTQTSDSRKSGGGGNFSNS